MVSGIRSVRSVGIARTGLVGVLACFAGFAGCSGIPSEGSSGAGRHGLRVLPESLHHGDLVIELARAGPSSASFEYCNVSKLDPDSGTWILVEHAGFGGWNTPVKLSLSPGFYAVGWARSNEYDPLPEPDAGVWVRIREGKVTTLDWVHVREVTKAASRTEPPAR
jgi:hypothetical protein